MMNTDTKYTPLKIDYKYLYKQQQKEFDERQYIKKELTRGLVFVIVLTVIMSLLIIL